MGEETIPLCDNQYTVGMTRNPLTIKNYFAYWELKKLLKLNNYDIIHCHTPTAGFLTRLAAKNSGAKIIYTVHGFHFFHGAPFYFWLFYYPIEKYLSRFTDCLITINREDFEFAKKHIAIPIIKHIDGVGVDLQRFCPASKIEKHNLRKEMGYADEQFIVLYTAEFIPRKNHKLLLKEIDSLRQSIPLLKVIFAGKGPLQNKIVNWSRKSCLSENIDFLGYRYDMDRIYKIADIHVSVSRQEGLSINNIEAQASGIPLVCSKIRGHTDTIIHGRNGFLFDLSQPKEMTQSILRLYHDNILRQEIAINNRKDVGRFSVADCVQKIAACYKKVFTEETGT
jgi:glycosyltransferase EpsD